MVTIIVGKINESNSNQVVDIATFCDGADDPKRTLIDLKNLVPGLPK